ncbi:MAG TPA: tetratricopeptide repeat protein, partial [Allocoleopsis sp.]
TYYNLGLCFSQKSRLDEAIACFEKAIQIQPDFSQAYSDWGYALLKQGRLDEAIPCLKQAIKIQPGFSQAYSKLIDTLINQGRADEEIKSKAGLFKAIQEQQNSADLYFYLGNILRKNYLHIAILSYKMAIDIEPSSAELYLNLGKALAGDEKFDEAIASYQKALHLQADSAELYLNLGKAWAGKGNFDQAIASYQKALSINPDWSEGYCYLGNALSTIGKWNGAIACYKKTLELHPGFVEAYLNLGFALAQRNQVEEAIACFRNAIEINPDLAKTTYDLIMILCEQGRLDKKTLTLQQILPVEPPNSFYKSSLDWAIASHLEKSNYLSIYSSNFINLKPPKSLDSEIHFSFRFGGRIKLPASFVVVVPEGRYWLSKSQDMSAVITSDNQLLGDVSPDFPVLSPGHPDKHPSKHSIFSIAKLPPPERIDGTVVVLSGLSNDVYFHWMFDILPRIELLHMSGIDLSIVDNFITNIHFPFQRETLKILGISEYQILDICKYSHIKAMKLIVPSFPSSVSWMPKWSCDFLRNIFLNQSSLKLPQKIERLYISRQNTQNRRIINEDELISLLKKFDFKIVTLESMSVAEQAALLANAKVVVAPHGGGLTNTVFCSSGTKVIEIFSPNYVYSCYWLISNLLSLDYYYLLGESPVGVHLYKTLYPSCRIEDIFVNLDKLLRILKLADVI